MALQNHEGERRAATGTETVAPFTLQDINAALAASHEDRTEGLVREGYLSAQQWADLWKVTVRTAQRKLAELDRAALLDTEYAVFTCLGKVRREKPVYKILIKKKE